ncbi:hypothetical protein AUJ69_00870 [Candidatus Woesearchaeota archaeon CG1_02_47_18]|nr:MAG: hypothetical protein AUJ69_00870 [Candidatus Woesearchaeota archaeon CG1_02_47_18]
MFKKEGMPEEGEIVLCTVTNVQSHSVFVRLDEYNRAGMIHISEVSSGRIRNMRDFVREGKVVICKVLNINQERGHIDLSLRRVTESQRRLKSDEIKQEQKSEKIIGFIASKLKMGVEELYEELNQKLADYGSLFNAFVGIASGNVDIEKLGIKKDIRDALTSEIRLRIKPAEVEVHGRLSLVSYSPNGLNVIKTAVLDALKSNEGVVMYEGGRRYSVTVKAPDYKGANDKIKRLSEAIIRGINDQGGEGSFAIVDG